MAFIREYMAESGDPFSLRIPRKLRKLKVGRALGKVARAAVGFVPGVGGIASSLIDRLAARYPQVPTELWEGFARTYGLDMGDPGAPKVKSKRKGAASGTKAKAERKAQTRAERKTRPQTHPASKGKGPSGTRSLGGALAGGADLLRELNAFGVSGSDLEKVLGGGKEFLGGGLKGRAAGFGSHRRRVNPANVKALNRSLRRVEGFEKLAARVFKNKLFRRVRGGGGAHAPRSGHKSGCKCVACRGR